MKWLITLIFIVHSFSLTAQNIIYAIIGHVKNPEHAKFAYLSTNSHQVTISSQKIFTVTPIVNGKFEFNGTFNLEGKKYQHACIFIDDRATISKEELASKFKNLVWVVDREDNFKHIILEDMHININERNKTSISKISQGGILTKQFEEQCLATREKNRKLIEFVKKYPDSPMTLDAVREISDLTTLSNKDKLESIWGSPPELYILLSRRLKSSRQGLALKKKIDKFQNLQQ